MCRATEGKGKEQVSEGSYSWEKAVREDTGQLKVKQRESAGDIMWGALSLVRGSQHRILGAV